MGSGKGLVNMWARLPQLEKSQVNQRRWCGGMTFRNEEHFEGSYSVVAIQSGFFLGRILTMVLEESSTFVSCLHKQIPFGSLRAYIRRR